MSGKKKASAPVAAPEADYVPAKDPAAAEAAGISKGLFGPHACLLVSRMDQPMTVSYKGEALVLPPRAGSKHEFVIEDSRLLGALPKGVSKLPLPSSKKAQ